MPVNFREAGAYRDLVISGCAVTISSNATAKHVIKMLADMGIPVSVVQLGCGVKRISCGTVCEHCKGKGFIE